jgi:hypothetical protein
VVTHTNTAPILLGNSILVDTNNRTITVVVKTITKVVLLVKIIKTTEAIRTTRREA